MSGWEFCGGFWWIFPLVMIVLCFLMMSGFGGRMMRGPGPRWWDCGRGAPGDSAREILEKRYAKGEIDSNEFEEKIKVLANERHAQNG